MPDARRLPEHVIDDRIRRYMSGEPLATIARDHGITREGVIATCYRHAPSLVGLRKRGGGTRNWTEEP